MLEHSSLSTFCDIPLGSLRENNLTELDLAEKCVGVPGAIVLSKLLPSAAALTLLKCAAAPSRACQAPLTLSVNPAQSRKQQSGRDGLRQQE